MPVKRFDIINNKLPTISKTWMRRVAVCFIIFVSIAFLTPSYAVEKMPQQLSADSLYQRGMRYYKNGDLKNSIICLQLLADRYTNESTDKECDLAVKANYILCTIYSHHLFDTAKAYEAILRANQIATEKGYDNPKILFNLASIFQTLSQQTGDMELAKKALCQFKTCIERTEESGQEKTMHLAMTNYLLLSRELNKPSLPEKSLWILYKQRSEKAAESIMRYNRLLYNIIEGERLKNYEEALKDATEQLNIIRNDSTLIRFKLVSNLIIFDILREKKAPCLEIENQLNILQQLANQFGHKDAQLLVYKLKWETFSNGECINYPKATLYAGKYMSLRDSLLNFQQLTSIKGVEMSQEIKTANQKMTEAQHKSQLHLLALCLSLIICMSITVFLIIIRNRNRRLSESNKKLYAQTVELLRQEELRVKDSLAEKQTSPEASKKKYATSNMTNNDKETLMERIRVALSTEAEIFTTNFTLARLSELIGASQRDISQAVNETTCSNFITLLNEYRIKEACRRFKNPKFRLMTLEALANSVGFKARSSFIAAFKKYTGLTPSQYKKLSETDPK